MASELIGITGRPDLQSIFISHRVLMNSDRAYTVKPLYKGHYE